MISSPNQNLETKSSSHKILYKLSLSLPPPSLRSQRLHCLGFEHKKQSLTYNQPINLTMLQLFFAVAFSAMPLTLYVPPIRSLSLLVETIEDFFRQTSLYTVRAYPRIRDVFSSIFRNIFNLFR